MKIFCPYAPGNLHPKTAAAMETARVAGHEVRLVELEDVHAYHRFWQARWGAEEKFINVEHDVAPTVAQMQEIWDCRKEWCSCGYHPQGDLIPFFGCVKISIDLIKVHKKVWDVAPMDWTRLDSFLVENKNVYFVPHLHGSVWHAKHARFWELETAVGG